MPDEIRELKPIQSGGIDFQEFDGAKKTIARLDVVVVPSTFSETGKTKALKIITDPVTTLKNKEGEEIEVRASELVNLKVGPSGELGYSTNPKSKLQKLMKKLKVTKPADLKGKTVTIRVRTVERPDGTTSEYLGFYME